MPTSNFLRIRFLDLGCWYKLIYLMANSADRDQLASSEANWSGSTQLVKAGYIWVQLDQGHRRWDILDSVWATSSKKVSLNMSKMGRFRSSCAKYHLSFCFPSIHSVVSNDSVSGQQRPWSDYKGPAKSFITGSDYFSVMFYQTYFYYKPSKYSPFTETHFCKLFTQSQKADK